MMTALPSEVDVAVIGAGAAGIAAGRRLAEAGGVSVLVLEARGRAGGRTWTVEKNGYPLDLGGEWLHSADRNVLTPLAERLGFELYRRRPDWTMRLRNSGATPAEEQEWIADREAHYWAIHRAALEAEDRAAAPPAPAPTRRPPRPDAGPRRSRRRRRRSPRHRPRKAAPSSCFTYRDAPHPNPLPACGERECAATPSPLAPFTGRGRDPSRSDGRVRGGSVSDVGLL